MKGLNLLLALSFLLFVSLAANASDAAWTTKHEGKGIIHTASITSTATRTEVLDIEPENQVSYGIDIGSGETVGLYIDFKHHDDIDIDDMLVVDSAITADTSNSFTGPISGLMVSGAVTNTTVITVIQNRE